MNYRNDPGSIKDCAVRRDSRGIRGVFGSSNDSGESKFVGQTLRNIGIVLVAAVGGFQVEQILQEVALGFLSVRSEIVNSRIVSEKEQENFLNFCVVY